MRPRH